MGKAAEPLGAMEDPRTDYSGMSGRGVYLSKSFIAVLSIIIALAMVASCFMVYNFAACPQTDRLANVTKHEMPHCDQTKLAVMPLANPNHGKGVIPLPPAPLDLRLPKTIRPEKYFLKLTPYIYEGNFSFDGEASIILFVKISTKRLTFHAVELTFRSVEVFDLQNRQRLDVLERKEDVPRQFQVLTLNETLKAGHKYALNVSYSGILNDDLHGFYRSSYEEKNITKWVAVTQFQATDARRAFPCWDEPALKANFTISIARPSNMTSVSNMNLVRSQPHEKLKSYVWDHFAESLPMSTYLVAFAVTDFGSMSSSNFTVWARREALATAEYALHVSPKILAFLEGYYKIKFPLPKIDMIALPDFKAGAMENWGLLTFREIAMLYDSSVSPATAKVRVASVVAHEIAHQWFGNLVTPAWWSDIWLNEGFASYVEYVAVDAVEKSWQLMELFVLNEIQSVFKLDALTSSHQISVEVANPEEIGAIFDKISYGKGSAILRMMNHFLTDEVFNAGITDYLNAKKFGHAEQQDLWSALSSSARRLGRLDADVAQVMGSWTLQTGFPVLSIARDYAGGALHFTQERFVLLNDTSGEKKPSPLWWIPVSFTTAAEKDFLSTRPKVWMRGERALTLRNVSIANDEWLIANLQQTGFYRVNYDSHNWQLLIKVLNDPQRFEEIHPINRAQIVDDSMNLALAGRLPYTTALDVISYLKHERSYVPWKAGLVALGYIDTMMSKGPYYVEYKKYVLSLLEGVLGELGWELRPGEGVVRTQQRADVLATACHLQHADCLAHTARLFTSWMQAANPDSDNDVRSDVRGAVYCAGVRSGGGREWAFARARFGAAGASAERELLLAALACTREPHLLSRFLEMALRNDSGVRKQDAVRVFSAVAGSGEGQPVAFDFVRANWQRVRDYVGSLSTLNSILKVVTRRLNQPYEYQELKRFVSESCKELGRPIQQVLERTAANVQWMQRNYAPIVKWLQASAGQSSDNF